MLNSFECLADWRVIQKASYIINCNIIFNLTGTIININSGWIVDGLIIARSNHRVIHGGSNLGGSSHFFVLQQDEFITNIEGANCYFQNTRICGRIAIATNKRRIGSFGHAGNPDGSDQRLTYRTFSMSMVEFGDIQLQSVGYRNQYLGQVISQ